VRTTDFLLHPSSVIHREHIAAGVRPAGELRVSRWKTGEELVLAIFEDPTLEAVPLEVPLSLYDELGLLWKEAVPTWSDDRWAPSTLAAFETRVPGIDERTRIGELLKVHLAARIEGEDERFALLTRLAEWTEG
jgi:hypothetical protein